MKGQRSIERIVGVLFVAATLASSLGMILLDPILDKTDLLAGVAADENRVMLGAFLLLVNAVAIVVIAVLLHPILIKHNTHLARLYPASRIVESVVIVVGVVGLLSLITLAEDHLPAGADATASRISATSLLAVYDWGMLLGILLFFGLAALILNAHLYRSQLVPRWLAAWGLIGAALLLIEGAFESFGADNLQVLSAPIAIQEVVFAGWLIVKGFATAIPSDSTAQEPAKV